MKKPGLSRRGFLQLAGIGFTSLALHPPNYNSLVLPEFPQSERLGRVAIQGKVELKARPDVSSQTLGVLYEDAVLPWLRETPARNLDFNNVNQRWIETPEGFLNSRNIQPVRNIPNKPVEELNRTAIGQGMWAEVTVPYLDARLNTTPTSNSWVKAKIDQGLPVRVYYEMVFWVDQLKVDDTGNTWYRINPNFYGGVDMLWVPAEGMRPITREEIVPINPDVQEKRIIVDVIQQSLSCFEGKNEVYYCRVSTGAKFDMYGNAVDKWATPIGQHRVARKYVTLQMSGGTTGASYDLPGIGWTTIFVTGGVAFHSTFWHNDFGVPRSHGCVNLTPQDAKWIFRWTSPSVSYDTGMVDVSQTGEESTRVDVVEI
jgi:lipoprotein-anchoring transpeptidase ErfK/SrfK